MSLVLLFAAIIHYSIINQDMIIILAASLFTMYSGKKKNQENLLVKMFIYRIRMVVAPCAETKNKVSCFNVGHISFYLKEFVPGQ